MITYFRIFRILSYFAQQKGIPFTDQKWLGIAVKLHQLEFLEERIWELNQKSEIMFRTDKSAKRERLELEILTHSFYHFAWALKEVFSLCFFEKNFDFPKINRVRNKLLVHVERHIESFAFGGREGPIIRPDDKLGLMDAKDEGFLHNVEEMKKILMNVHKKLDPAFSKAAFEEPDRPLI